MLARITLDLFPIKDTWLSPALMILGSVGILIPVMMALVQKNYKRLLSYHAISQVGYMILGLGTALPAGRELRVAGVLSLRARADRSTRPLHGRLPDRRSLSLQRAALRRRHARAMAGDDL